MDTNLTEKILRIFVSRRVFKIDDWPGLDGGELSDDE